MTKNPLPRLILIGLRGTGKSTLAQVLSARLGWPAKDTDAEVQRETGKSIRELFAEEGEESFRLREAETVERLMRHQPLVLATGGGVVLLERNRRLLRQAGWVVWLTGAPTLLAHRLAADPASWSGRPALTKLPLAEELARLGREREPLYRECADLELCTDDQTPEQIADRLLKEMPWTCTT